MNKLWRRKRIVRIKSVATFLVSLLLLVGILAGCSNSNSGSNTNSNTSSKNGGSSKSSSSAAKVTVWSDVSGDAKKVIQKMADRYTKNNPNNVKIDAQFFAPNPYKQKLQIVMGAKKAPDIFSNWGGGRLNDFIKAGDVVDMTSAVQSSGNKYLPAIMKSVTFNGKIYGVPHGNIQQVNFFYNKQLFQKYNLTPPTTWAQFQHDITVFKSHGVAPVALGAKDKWPDLMWFEYLVDRIGGPQVFQNVVAGKTNAWSDPAILQATKMMQKLANEGAFENGYSSVGSGNGEDAALLYTGKAAMWLMGSWGYTSVLSDDKSFIDNGNLGWFAFPSVAGGKGNPKDVAGNPSEFYSISANSSNKKAATDFLMKGNLNKQNIQDLINIGNVPPIDGIDSQLKQAKHGDYMSFSYELIKNAPYFQQSWDTALNTKVGNRLDDDLSKLLIKQMTPQQLSDDMAQFSASNQ